MTIPTDAELDLLWSDSDIGPESEVHRQFARAVLAKWGQPQAVAGGEPVAWRSAVLDLIDDCPGLSLEQDRWLSRRVKELDFPSAPPPQAVREPTERERSLIAALRYECDHAARNGMRMEERYGHPWSKGVGVPETTIDAVIEGWHRAHGITKGGQHGAE